MNKLLIPDPTKKKMQPVKCQGLFGGIGMDLCNIVQKSNVLKISTLTVLFLLPTKDDELRSS
jgi:hypothetical protein